ncbi:hypothetical protein FGIG_12569 [Fasciola gigantica]|uniref:Uncharacterized protein n=1 Tax=Fasciola gigantica TaxID=46835 RepID=A0A504YIY1_FASGI|nr:hypothetical protein FGIG_12569 [Fasciola gigantica]
MATGSELPKDEEGFTIRPSDPWAEPTCEDQSDQGVSDSDSDVDIVGRTFKGLKVNIRPPGDFVPGMATLPSPKKPSPGSRYSNTTRLSVRGRDLLLVDLRGSKHGRNGVSARSVNLTKAHPNQTTTNLLQVLPTAPALPPPPPAANNGPSDELSFLMDSKEPKASVVRPRASGVHTWSRSEWQIHMFVY